MVTPSESKRLESVQSLRTNRSMQTEPPEPEPSLCVDFSTQTVIACPFLSATLGQDPAFPF